MAANCGGYDHDLFLDKNTAEEPRYSCTICTKVFKDPHLTACCGQHFCESCLEEWLKKKDNCPNCRETGLQHFVDKSLKREINTLRMKCPHNKDGCTCELELGSLKQHLESESGCGYALVLCPKDCFANELRRKDLNTHLETECSSRLIDCSYCGKRGKFSDHGKSCRERIMECTRGCGKKFKRKKLFSHIDKCPLQETDCPFKDAGCEVRPVRNKLKEHMDTSVQDHLLVMAQAFQKSKRRDKAIASIVNVVLESNRWLSMENQRALRSARSLLDADTYHLKREMEDIELTTEGSLTMHSTRGGFTSTYVTPPFYITDGYKMDLEFKLCTQDERVFTLVCHLRLLEGEYDDLLEWPLKNNHSIKVDIELGDCNSATEDDLTLVDEDPDSDSEDCLDWPWFSLTEVIPICCHCRIEDPYDRQSSTPLTIGCTRDVLRKSIAEMIVDDSGLTVTVFLHRHEHAKRRKTSDE